MKIAIPLVALLLVAVVFLASRDRDKKEAPRVEDSYVENVSVTGTTTAETTEPAKESFPRATRTQNEYSYGLHEKQKMDVYALSTSEHAPIIVMVHGGGWIIGDKGFERVYKNKADRWVPQGYMFIAINYPMLGDGYRPDAQADSIALALEYIQKNAGSWGGDASRMVVMGHSAGAHLVSLMSAIRNDFAGLAPWNATVLLDSAAYDLVETMSSDPSRIYENAFGDDENYWKINSPIAGLHSKVEPTFLVCSSLREKSVCDGAEDYATALKNLGGAATLLKMPLSHEEINSELGLQSDYTEAVEDFIEQHTR